MNTDKHDDCTEFNHEIEFDGARGIVTACGYLVLDIVAAGVLFSILLAIAF